MTIFYIEREKPKTVFALDSTSSSMFKAAGKATSFPIEDGGNSQDNYVNENNIVEFKGKISTTKSLSSKSNMSPEDYIRGLLELKALREPFNIYWGYDKSELKSCVFLSLQFLHDKSSGIRVGDINVTVSFTVKQLRFANQAEVDVAPSENFTDKVEKEVKGDGGGKDGIKELRTIEKVKASSKEAAQKGGAQFLGIGD